MSTLTVNLKLISKAFVDNLKKAKDALKNFGKEFDFVGLDHFRESISGVISSLNLFKLTVVAVVAVVASLALSISAGSELQTAMAELEAITGATGAELDSLKQKAKNLAVELGSDATSIAQSFTLMASAKPELLKDLDALAVATKEAIKLAQAAGMSNQDAVNSLASALNQFGAGADKANQFINVLAAGSKFGSSMINQTSDALKNAGVAAKAAGLSFEQTNASVQLLAKFGIRGSEAGIKVRNFLATLSSSGKMLRSFGIDINDVNPEVVGLENALNNLAAANLNSSQYAQLFMKQNKDSARILIENRAEIIGLTKDLTGTNVAYEQAAVQINTLSQEWGTFKGSAALLGTAIFDKIQGPIRSSLASVNSLTLSVANLFSQTAIAAPTAIGHFNEVRNALNKIDGKNVEESIKKVTDAIYQGNISYEQGTDIIRKYKQSLEAQSQEEERLSSQIKKKEQELTDLNAELTKLESDLNEDEVLRAAQRRMGIYELAYNDIELIIEESHQKAYKKAIEYAEKFANRAIELEEQIENAQKTHEERIRELKRKQFGEQFAEADKAKEVNEKIAAAREAQAQGELETARELLESAGQKAAQLDNEAIAIKLVEEAHQALLPVLEQQRAQAESAAAEMEKIGKEQSVKDTQNQIEDLTGGIEKLREKLVEVGKQVIEPVIDTTQVETAVDHIKAELDSIPDKTVNVKVNTQSGLNAGGEVFGFNRGGLNPKDTVPAMLTPGEFVVTANQGRSAMAKPLLEMINFAPISQVKDFLKQPLGLNLGGFVPQLAMANGGSIPSASNESPMQTFVIRGEGSKKATLRGQQAQIDALADILLDASRGTR